MNPAASARPTTVSHHRWFYSAASLALLVIMFMGFKLFYMQGQAFPGRPLTPPIRTLVIVHACLMTGWMLLSLAQALLVGAGHKRLHMKLGLLGALLAAGIVVAGVQIGIAAARFSPPDLRVFGLAPREFMTVPVLSILVFAMFVLVGFLNRRRPAVHRPMMLMASVAVIGAAFGRIPLLNAFYAGTWWEVMFTAFLVQVIFAALLLVAKCLVSRSFDRWFATAFAAMTISCVAISLTAKTQAWDRVAVYLIG